MVHRAALFEGYKATHTCVSTIYFEGKQKKFLTKISACQMEPLHSTM